jgi:hypothetical protein
MQPAISEHLVFFQPGIKIRKYKVAQNKKGMYCLHIRYKHGINTIADRNSRFFSALQRSKKQKTHYKAHRRPDSQPPTWKLVKLSLKCIEGH